jgi:hypothetical protein
MYFKVFPLDKLLLNRKKLKQTRRLHMKNTLIRKIVLLAVAGGVLLSATSALAGSDAFNRPKFGKTWVVTAGSLSISNRQLVGTSTSLGYQKGSSVNTAGTVVVFLGGTDTEYGAVALGNIAGGSNAFVKLQSQNGAGTFDTAGFYTGNNSGLYFFTLSSPVPSPAVLDVFFCGTTATMRITSGAGIQTYTYNYGTTYGSGVGLGTYGSVGLDNYIGFASSCTDGPVGAVPALLMPSQRDLSLVK